VSRIVSAFGTLLATSGDLLVAFGTLLATFWRPFWPGFGGISDIRLSPVWGEVDLGSISGSGGRSQDLGVDLRISDVRSDDLRDDLRIWGSISGSGGRSQDLGGRFGVIWGHLGTSQGYPRGYPPRPGRASNGPSPGGVKWGSFGGPQGGSEGVIWGHLGHTPSRCQKGGRFWTPFPEGPQMAPFGQWPDSQFWLWRPKGTLLVSGRFGFLGVRNLVIWGKKRPRNVGLFEMTCSKKSEFKTLRS